MRLKNEEAPESRESCSGAVRGLVNLFPGFSEFQGFILTRPHFYSFTLEADGKLDSRNWCLFGSAFLRFRLRTSQIPVVTAEISYTVNLFLSVDFGLYI